MFMPLCKRGEKQPQKMRVIRQYLERRVTRMAAHSEISSSSLFRRRGNG